MQFVRMAVVAAFAAYGVVALAVAGRPHEYAYLLFLAVGLFAVKWFRLRLPVNLSYSLDACLTVGGAVLSGFAGPLWLAVADSIIIFNHRDRTWERNVFNFGQKLACASIGAAIYLHVAPLSNAALAGAVAVVGYLAANAFFVGGMVLLDQDPIALHGLLNSLRQTFVLQWLQVLAGGLLASVLQDRDAAAVVSAVALLAVFGLTSQRLSRALTENRRDVLTEIWNLRAFADDLQGLLETARRPHQTFGLVVLDLDRFKSINDTYGHDVGNIVLKVATERLQHNIRRQDRIYRIGGEEFAIIMPDVTPDTLAERVGELSFAISSDPLHVGDNPPFTVSASFGWSLCPDDGRDYETLFRVADRAMYASKQAQRQAAAAQDAASGNELDGTPGKAAGKAPAPVRL